MSVERVGVSFDPELLQSFDELIESKGYASRSEAVRDLVRKSIIDSEVKSGTADVIGTLTYVYNHHEADATNRLMRLQHDHLHEIQSTTHVHVDHDMCLEVLIVRGKAKEVSALSDRIKATKGVKHGELVVTRVNY